MELLLTGILVMASAFLLYRWWAHRALPPGAAEPTDRETPEGQMTRSADAEAPVDRASDAENPSGPASAEAATAAHRPGPQDSSQEPDRSSEQHSLPEAQASPEAPGAASQAVPATSSVEASPGEPREAETARDGSAGATGKRSTSDEALDAVIALLYPGAEAVSPRDPGALGTGQASAYPREKPVPHWHYVARGFIGSKVDPDAPALALTLRIPKDASGNPPTWPLGLFERVAAVAKERRPEPFETLELGEPVVPDAETGLAAVALVPDPELPAESRPAAEVLQLVGLTRDELDSLRSWNPAAFMALVAERHPLSLTDPGRPSVLQDPGVSARVAAGRAQDGSSTEALAIETLEVAGSRVTLGAMGVASLLPVLEGRLLFERSLSIRGRDHALVLRPAPEGSASSVEQGDEGLTVTLGRRDARALVRSLAPRRGIYRVASLPELEIVVRPSSVRRPTGEVVELIG